ncbi:MAG: HPr family phosphocarrier protein [Spirochaetaceae bacterium]|jgi:phosphocarrier protein|nr:HPr family phosphocarrier protein [Spirochaetaceae bacterium]
MITFNYTIKDELGIHARPAGVLIREVKKFKSAVSFSHGEKKADGDKIFAIMKLGIKQGNVLGVTVEGDDEQEAAEAIRTTLETYL